MTSSDEMFERLVRDLEQRQPKDGYAAGYRLGVQGRHDHHDALAAAAKDGDQFALGYLDGLHGTPRPRSASDRFIREQQSDLEREERERALGFRARRHRGRR